MGEIRKDIREFKSIDCITLSMGRTGELKPADVFPSLAELPAATESEEDDVDPRDTFSHFQTMNQPRMETRRIKAPDGKKA